MMADETQQNMDATTTDTAVPSAVAERPARSAGRNDNRDRRGQGGQRGPRRGGNRPERERSEFAQKMIGIRRVARVMAGGRRFNFSVAIVIGDKKGRVGVGVGKAADTQLAIEKATRHAKRHMITINLTKNRSIKHNVEAKFCASVVEIRPSPGRGLVAGSSVRSVLEMAGVSDVTAKLISRSKNPINNARAALQALASIAMK
jgi:small subunit ribosomal protein S5